MKNALLIFLTLLITGASFAQDIKTYDKNGLKFNYPADWTLTDASSADIQNVSLAKKGSNVMISSISPAAPVTSQTQYDELKTYVNKYYVDAIREGLNPVKKGDKPEFFQPKESDCVNLNGRMLSGDRITGAFNNLPATGDIYPLVLGNRFATLIFLRTEAVNPAGQSAWRGMLDTLSLAGSNKDAADLDFQFIPIESGVINGRAIKMPSPKRPNVRGILSGTQTVLIRVQTDLEGNVISARAESGNQLLWQAAIDAAKKAKFAPTMRCGVPLKIAGVIVYKFLPGLNGQF